MLYEAFNAHAEEYDAWYDSEAGQAILAMEVDCLSPFLNKQGRPYLEIGVGSGRFARALGIEYGVDPARGLLGMARARGIGVVQAVGEGLPFSDGVFGGALIALTLCFVADPLKVVEEASRVLVPGGGLVLGLILQSSPWAAFYTQKGSEGHPLYSKARFFSQGEVARLLKGGGFRGLEYRSVLFQSPGQRQYTPEDPVPGYWPSAGFTAIGSIKREP